MATSVATFAELKKAIEDTTTNEILVSANITFASGGAKVNVAKSSLVIDFDGHTVVDNNSSSFTDTIYVSSTTNTLSVTVKNAVWSGRNYYGVVGVYDGNVNTTINLININYTGPQFVYNKYGTTNIEDCTVVLAQNGSSTASQEFCEANRLTISGKVDVTSSTTGTAVIWFTGTNAALTVQQNASFVVNALSTYFLYTDVSPVMLFKQNSSTTITTKNGLFYAASSSSHIAQSFTLEQNASFVAYKNASNAVPMFKCISNFTLGNNSTFQLFAEGTGSAALVYFGQTANINITNPKSVVLYSQAGNVFSFQTGSSANPNVMNIKAEMLRLWGTAKTPLTEAGNFLDTPTSEYHKLNYTENVEVAVKATNSQLTSVESNITSQDVGYPLDTSSFKLLSSKVVGMGSLILSIDEITDKSLQITGKTDPNANLKAEFEQSSLTAVADSVGNYALNLTSTLPIGTKVTIGANKEFLTKTILMETVGSVSVFSVDELKFKTFTSLSNLSVVFRQNADFGITIEDTRPSGGNWFLYAYIENPLTSGSNTLEDAIVLKQNELVSTISKQPLLVYTGKSSESGKTLVSWDAMEGFLLNIEPQKTYAAGEYETQLLWQVLTTELT